MTCIWNDFCFCIFFFGWVGVCTITADTQISTIQALFDTYTNQLQQASQSHPFWLTYHSLKVDDTAPTLFTAMLIFDMNPAAVCEAFIVIVIVVVVVVVVVVTHARPLSIQQQAQGIINQDPDLESFHWSESFSSLVSSICVQQPFFTELKPSQAY